MHNKSKFKDDMEVRSFPKMSLPRKVTSPGGKGEGVRKSSKISTEQSAKNVSKFHPEDTGNLK